MLSRGRQADFCGSGRFRAYVLDTLFGAAGLLFPRAWVLVNGPIEELHAGRPCAACSGNSEISHITDEQMRAIMKSAVDRLYRLLWQRECDPVAYNENLALGRGYTRYWDDPELKRPRRKGSRDAE